MVFPYGSAYRTEAQTLTCCYFEDTTDLRIYKSIYTDRFINSSRSHFMIKGKTFENRFLLDLPAKSLVSFKS